ncbi:MAG: hypothetical protein DIU71_08155, partial [Proteobacteria bacterium]
MLDRSRALFSVALRNAIRCTLGAGTLGLAAGAAAAAEQSQAPALEEVVVTAQFRTENLQDTPIAITAVTADMLEAR